MDPTWSGEACDDRLRVLYQDGATSAVPLFLALRKPRRAAGTGRGIRRPGKRLGDSRDGRPQGRGLCGASEDRDGTVRRAPPVGDGRAKLIGGGSAFIVIRR